MMVPRQDMVAVDLEDPVEEYIDEILESMHSRIPVYEGEIDNIIGILSMKDFMIKAKETSFTEVDIRSIMREPFFVPENQKTDVLFKEMQKNKTKVAILIDEYGGVSGMVTMEDLVEEIVGDIQDEHEDEEPEISSLEPHKVYKVMGGIQIFDLNEELHLHIESACDTLSGYLIEQLGYIPHPEDLPLKVETEEADYEVMEMDDRVIQWVKLTLKDKPKPQVEEL